MLKIMLHGVSKCFGVTNSAFAMPDKRRDTEGVACLGLVGEGPPEVECGTDKVCDPPITGMHIPNLRHLAKHETL